MTTVTIPFARIGKDGVQVREHNGTTFGTFSVAVDQGYGDKKTTVWYDCVVNSDILSRMQKAQVKQGSAISLTGILTFKDVEKRDGSGKVAVPKISVLAWDYVKTASKKEDGNTASPPPAAPAQQYEGVGEPMDLDDDDLPF